MGDLGIALTLIHLQCMKYACRIYQLALRSYVDICVFCI